MLDRFLFICNTAEALLKDTVKGGQPLTPASFTKPIHEGTQIAWTVSILESPIQFTVTTLQ